MSEETSTNWTEIDDSTLENAHGYNETTQGWKQSDNGAEVLIFKPQEAGMHDVTDKEWAVMHPWDEEIEDNVSFYDSEKEATKAAKKWMRDHPAPTNAY